jgi:transposase
MKKEEEYTLYKQHDENKITSKTFNKGLEKAGKILLVSNVDLAPENVFLMYKKRDTLEKHYYTYKSILEADKLYLQDNVTRLIVSDSRVTKNKTLLFCLKELFL